MLPAVHPLKTGALCLAAALTLGLAAGSLGLGPGRHPARRLLRRRLSAPSRRPGGRVAVLGVGQALLRGGLAHPVRLPAARRRAAVTGASIAGVLQATRDAATTTERAGAADVHRRHGPAPGRPDPGRGRAARARERGAGRARHARGGARPRRLRALSGHVRRADEEPEPEPRSRGRALGGAGARAAPAARLGWGARAGGAHPDGQPAVGGHRGRRLRLPPAQAGRS